MSENKETPTVETPAAPEAQAAPAPAAEPQVKLKPGLFQGFTLGSSLKPGAVGNVMTNVKPSPMDYEKTYKTSGKNQELTPEQLAAEIAPKKVEEKK